VHEGGFTIERDSAGGNYFQRPDGRVIPRFGYRLDDICDDYAVEENLSTAVEETPSMEVREPLGAYASRDSVGVVRARTTWLRA